MKKTIRKIIAAAMVLTMLPVTGAMPAGRVFAASSEKVVLDPANASPFNNGEFEGWGTSMGWWGNRIGYSDALAEKAAELFYSEEGLGLDIVRYNVGGGDHPDHNHITRSDSKLPCFAVAEYEEGGTTLKKDENGDVVYTYNWDADYNQVNVLKNIKKQNQGVHIEGYTNSPPWFMTNSQCSSGGVNSAENLNPANYDIFAEFLGDVTEHFEEIGLKFDSYSPMNEPSTQTTYWGANSYKQEGNHVAPGANQSNLILALDKVYTERGIDTLIAGPDETSIDYSITSFGSLTDDAKAALDRLDTHTYGGSKRAQLKQTAIDGGKTLWMSEVDGKWDEFGIADRIIADVNGMQPAAWVLWDIIDFHKDSDFRTPDGTASEAGTTMSPDSAMWGIAMANHDNETIELSQKYYGMGQFTRYINPGDTIIASSADTLAAYNKHTGDIKIVAVNSGSSAKNVTFDMSAFTQTGSKAKLIRTSGSFATGEKWADAGEVDVVDKQFTAELKADSITTFVIDNEKAVIDSFEADANGMSYSFATSEAYRTYDKYFAVYDKDGVLKYVSVNKVTDSAEGDFTDCTAKLFVWDGNKPVIEAVSGVGSDDMQYMTISGDELVFLGDEPVYTSSASDNSDITWSVSDETIATIDENGRLTTLKEGTVTVTATSQTAGSRSMTVEILETYKLEIPAENVTGSNAWNNGTVNVPNKVVDGSTGTFFDGVTQGYVVLDLGIERDIDMIGYAPRTGYEYRMTDGMFYGSNDNENWTLLYTVPTKPAANVITYVRSSDFDVEEATYRYIKYTVPAGNNSDGEAYNCNLSEIEVYANLTDAEKIDLAIEAMYVPTEVYGNITLPTTGKNGVAVSWETSDADVITDEGSVTRGTEDAEVTLTATFTLGEETKTKDYTMTVKAKTAGKTEEDMAAYLFVHFVGTEASASDEQIYFSVSQDGTTWETINEGLPVLTSNVGEKGVRDPHIIRSPEGDKFFLIATDLSIYNRRGDSNRWSTCQTSGSQSIVIWESTDLVNWSEARLIKVADPNAGCTWAPESIYDAESERYMVFWASKVSDDNYSKQRIYRSFTTDFVTFTEPEIYIEDDVSNIDTSFVVHDGVYYRFTKNESKSSVIMEKSETLNGTFEEVSTYTINGTAGNTITGYEGPTAYKINGEDKWCLLLDYYSKSQGYKPFVTDDIATGVFTSAADFNFDTKYRHGTVMPITQEEYDALIAKYTPEAETGEVIFEMNFDSETVEPTIGKATASGTITYTDSHDGTKAAVLDGSDFITITKADGTPLLAGLDTFSVSFMAKSSGQSWWFYSAPNTTAQTYKSEKYVGVLDKQTSVMAERYNSNNIDRPSSPTATVTSGEWKHITVVHNQNSFTLYVNGVKVSTAASTVALADMLGNSPVCYIGKANWGTGEYSNGSIDSIKVYNYALGAEAVKAEYDALTTAAE